MARKKLFKHALNSNSFKLLQSLSNALFCIINKSFNKFVSKFKNEKNNPFPISFPLIYFNTR